MEDGQHFQPGVHARSPHTVYKVLRNEREPVPILPQQMAVMNVGDWQRKRRSAPRRRKDAQVRDGLLKSKLLQ